MSWEDQPSVADLEEIAAWRAEEDAQHCEDCGCPRYACACVPSDDFEMF